MKRKTWCRRFFNPVACVMVVALLGVMAEPGITVDTQRSVDAVYPADLTAAGHNCRFWGIISEAVPAAVIQDHLVILPNSIENLSPANPDGWSMGYYIDGSTAPTINRGFPRAIDDPNFDLAVTEAASATPRIAVSHVRNTSAGLIPDSGNPHPFERVKGGRHWLMGHNGAIDKDVLLDLIRPDYLAANPPLYGSNESEWLDSDLYQIFVLQALQAFDFHVKPALGYVIRRLREEIGSGTLPETEQLNFFLTDGTTLWAYREGTSAQTLYYLYDTTSTPYSAIASQYPFASQGNWVTVENGQLVTMQRSVPPVVEDIEAYSDLVVDNFFDDSADSAALRSNDAGQDWYESRELNQGLLALDETPVGGNSTKKAVLQASAEPMGNVYLSQEFAAPQVGTFSVQWDIYVDEIYDIGEPDRAGWMLIGDDTNPVQAGPNSDGDERFVYMGFFREGGGTTGTMDLIARDRDDGWTAFTTVASGLSFGQWYTIRVVCDIPSGTYDVYVDGVFQRTVTSRNEKGSVTHISFAQWSDGAGTFYVDNVHQAIDGTGHTLTVIVDPAGSGSTDPAAGTYVYSEDATVTITASPNAGYEFDRWSGDATVSGIQSHSNSPTATVVMDGDKVVTAHLEFIPVPDCVPIQPAQQGILDRVIDPAITDLIWGSGFAGDGESDFTWARLNDLKLGVVQTTFGSSSPVSILSGLSDADVVTLADLDRDGQLDLVYNEGSVVRIARNTAGATGAWNTTWTVGTATGTVSGLAAADLNGDGQTDLISVSGSTIQIWQNPATPGHSELTFGASWTAMATLSAPGAVDQPALLVADLDRDSAPDLVTGGADGAIHLWQNPRGPSWALSRSLTSLTGVVRDLASADLNHDSYPDLIVTSGGSSPRLRVWRNPGAPFSASWSTRQDLDDLALQEGTLNVADLNDDHRLDVIAADMDGVVYVWEQPVSSPFGTTWSRQQVIDGESSVSDLIVVDLEYGTRDELVLVRSSTPFRLEMWQVKSGSTEWQMTLLGQSDSALLSLNAGDLDRDGDADVISGRAEKVLAWENDYVHSPVRFESAGQSVGASGNTMCDLDYADVDDDGDIDLISVDFADRVTVWRNDGTPFEDSWDGFVVGVGTPGVLAMAAGDMDGDGDVDAVVGYQSGEVAVWQNNGSLSGWQKRVVGQSSVRVNALTLGDIDGDGKLDIVGGGGNNSWSVPPTPDNRVTVWLNGTLPGTWSTIDVGEVYYTARSVAVGDLDNDGDADIVIGTNHAPPEGTSEDPVPRQDWPDVYEIRAFRNDGAPFAGGTSWHEINVGRDPEFESLAHAYHGYWGASVSSVSLADLDSDGDLDIVATEHFEGDFQVMGWENDGTPFSGELWRGSAISVGPFHNWLFQDIYASDTGDLDGDGDIDVVTGGHYISTGQAEVIVWENTGIAFHEVVSQTHWLRHDTGEFDQEVNAIAVRVADLDADGDLDIASAGNTDSTPYAVRVWENTTNRAPDAPVYLAPSAEATNLPVTTTLTWQAGDPDGDVLTYTVALGTQNPPPVITWALTTTVYNAGALLAHRVHYWQISASDGVVTTTGPVWQFSTANRAPGVPYEPQPGDGALGQPLPVRLRWDEDDADGDALTYLIAFGDSDPLDTGQPLPLVASCATAAYDPDAMVGRTTYYWQVVASDGISTTSGPVWRFTTANQAPNVPSGPIPPNGTFGWSEEDVTLSWNGGDLDGDPITYTVIVSGSHGPAVEFISIEDARLALGGLKPGTVYDWQVSVTDGFDIVVGPVWQFTTRFYAYVPLVTK